MKTEINCRNCSALCCGPNQKIELTDEELNLLKSAGSSFTQKGVPKAIKRFDFIASDGTRRIGGTYSLSERCVFVIEKDGWLQCDIYNNPHRPFECRLFEAGEEGCRDIIKAGCVKDAGWAGQLLLKILDL